MLVVLYVVLGILSAICMTIGIAILAILKGYENNELPNEIKNSLEEALQQRALRKGITSKEENLRQVRNKAILCLIPVVNIILTLIDALKK